MRIIFDRFDDCCTQTVLELHDHFVCVNMRQSIPEIMSIKGNFKFDFFTANVMMPIGALLLAAFAGWAMQRESIRQEVGLADGTWYRIWIFLLRFLVPIGIIAILFSNLLTT